MPIRLDLIDDMLKDYNEQEEYKKKYLRKTYIILSFAACGVFNIAKFFLFYGGLVFGIGIDHLNLVITIFSYTFIFPLLFGAIFIKRYFGIIILFISAAIPFVSIIASIYLDLNYKSNDLLLFFIQIVWLPIIIGLGLIVIDFNLINFQSHKDDLSNSGFTK
jgi:hypothetical protein